MTERKSVLVLSHHPAPYRDPVLAAVIRREHFRWTIGQFSSAASEHPYWAWSPHGSNANVCNLGLDGRGTLEAFRRIGAVMRRRMPDVVIIPGLSHPGSRAALAAVGHNRIPFVYSADTIRINRARSMMGGLKRVILGRLYKTAGALWVPGSAAVEHSMALGVERARIFEGCYCLDEEELFLVDEERHRVRSAERRKLGIDPGAFVFLFVGRMIKARRPIDAALAIELLRARSPHVELLLVGDGPERSRIEGKIPLGGTRWLGPKPFRELSALYAVADAYVHPGAEPYSLAVAQAAMSRLPIVATPNVGATRDYVRTGKTGWLVPEGNVGLLSQAMAHLVSDPAEAMAMGELGGVLARRRGIDWAANQLEAAVACALASRAKKG